MKNRIMNLINQVILEVLCRGFRVLYRHDQRVRDEVDSWKKGLTLKLICGPQGPVLAMRQGGKSGIQKMPRVQHAQITMRFKSVSGAFQVMTGQISVGEAYAQHQFDLEGDIFQAMSFVRCVEYAEAYLFPKIWSRRILKTVPGKRMPSLLVYLLLAIECPSV